MPSQLPMPPEYDRPFQAVSRISIKYFSDEHDYGILIECLIKSMRHWLLRIGSGGENHPLLADPGHRRRIPGMSSLSPRCTPRRTLIADDFHRVPRHRPAIAALTLIAILVLATVPSLCQRWCPCAASDAVAPIAVPILEHPSVKVRLGRSDDAGGRSGPATMTAIRVLHRRSGRSLGPLRYPSEGPRRRVAPGGVGIKRGSARDVKGKYTRFFITTFSRFYKCVQIPSMTGRLHPAGPGVRAVRGRPAVGEVDRPDPADPACAASPPRWTGGRRRGRPPLVAGDVAVGEHDGGVGGPVALPESGAVGRVGGGEGQPTAGTEDRAHDRGVRDRPVDPVRRVGPRGRRRGVDLGDGCRVLDISISRIRL